LKQIIIPRNTLVMLCGPAGCGKSTFAARHFWRTQIVSSDECRALVCDDATDQGVTPYAFDLMHFIIETRLRLGRLTVADATHLKAEDRKPILKLARRARFNTAAVIFNVALATCLARNATRMRVVPEDALQMQHDLLQRTLATIEREGFDYITMLDETAQATASVKITRWFTRRFAPQ
jgi:predicted kinase